MAIPAVPKAAVSDKLGKAAPTQYTNIVQNKTAKEALSSQFWSTTRFINTSLQWMLENINSDYLDPNWFWGLVIRKINLHNS
jgi:hypothetical protein